jgi:hypothetical protein
MAGNVGPVELKSRELNACVADTGHRGTLNKDQRSRPNECCSHRFSIGRGPGSMGLADDLLFANFVVLFFVLLILSTVTLILWVACVLV